MTQTHALRRRGIHLAQAIALTLMTAPALLAQAAPARPAPAASWEGWLGCWAPVVSTPRGLNAIGEAPNVCITPAPQAGAAAVDVVTIADGKVVDRTTLNANGQHQASEREGCKGFDQTEWAPDGQQLYFHSEHLCDGGIERHSTGILSLNGAEWVDVRRVATSGTTGLIRAVHYRPLVDVQGIPGQILAQIPTDRGMSVRALRMASERQLTTADVIDAVRNVDAPVVEAWLVERAQPLAIDDRQLVKLADAHVPAAVIDVVVAVSFPKVFALNHSDFQGEQRPKASSTSGQLAAAPYDDPFYDYYGYNYGYNGYYNPYSAFYNPYGSGLYYGSRPVIVVVRGTTPINTTGGTGQPTSNPRVVNGQGYTQNKPAASSPPSSTSSGAGSPPPSSGSSGGSSSSGSGASSAGSGSTGRTAVPRCTAPKCD